MIVMWSHFRGAATPFSHAEGQQSLRLHPVPEPHRDQLPCTHVRYLSEPTHTISMSLNVKISVQMSGDASFSEAESPW